MLVATFVVCTGRCPAETLRVTTLNLEDMAGWSATSESAQRRINEAAQSLLKLRPDVILLEHVRDWQMCLQFAQALKPAEYNVLVCSSFRNAASASPDQPQVAILARQKAYMSWSEAWHADGQTNTPGGYVFAAIQAGKHRIGFFSLQMEHGNRQDSGSTSAPPSPQEKSVQQWLKAIDGCKKWVTNRIEGIVATGPFDPSLIDRGLLRTLEEAGFSNPFLEGTAEQLARAQVDGHLAANSRMPPGIILDHWPATCDLDLDAPESAAGSLVRAEPARGRLVPAERTTPTLIRASPSTEIAQAHSTPVAWLVAGALLVMVTLAAIAWILSRWRSAVSTRPAPLSLTAESGGTARPAYTVIVMPHSATGSVSGERVVSSTSRPLVRLAGPAARRSAGESETWDQRAQAAERQEEHGSATTRDGLLSHLSQWLKEKLVRRLIADRAQLLEMQQTAALKTLAMDERLAKVERQIQQQIRAYERRISELTRELEVAREGNRELIQAQITKVKAEMEAARARLMTEAKAEADR